jgi:ABC-type glycerol-3-phosphate transport system substrate-binding protein
MTEAWPKSYPSIHWQIVTPPVGPTGAPEVYEWAIYWAILNNIPEEKKNIAKEFLRYLVTDGQKWVVENEGLIPVNKDYVNLIYEKYKGTICIEALNLYKNLPSHGEPVHPNIQEIVNIYNSELQKVFLGEKTPEQAVKDMQKMALEVTKK